MTLTLSGKIRGYIRLCRRLPRLAVTVTATVTLL